MAEETTESQSTQNGIASRNILDYVSGNVHNEILPFSKINNFTFKKPENQDSLMRIYPFPSTLVQTHSLMTSKDTSLKQLSEQEQMEALIGDMPYVQISEYILDSRLKQIFTMIPSIYRGFKAGTNSTINLQELSKVLSNPDNLSNFKRDVIELMNGTTDELMREAAPHNFQQFFNQNYSALVKSQNSKNMASIMTSALKIPFLFYYCILSGKGTGVYTLPLNINTIDESDGHKGWNSNVMDLNIKNGASSLFGKLVEYAGANFRFDIQPQWRGGQDNRFPQFTIKFDLFNDSSEAAAHNYLFATNIVSKNKYLQYNLMQNNPAVYDVKLDGFNRFYMCSASIKCESNGVKRRPSNSVISEIMNYVNVAYKDILNTKNILEHDLIRIPDVYTITISFQSLLPNSINQNLFYFTANNKITEPTDSNLDFGNMLPSILDKASQKFLEKHQGIIVSQTNSQ